MLWQIYLPKIVRQCGQLSSSPPGSAAHLWWAMMIGWVIWVMKDNQNVKKAPLSHQKMKFSFLDYVQLLMISRAIWAMKFNWNVTKGPLSHQKMKCSILDYIQLLMISHAIQATKVDWNAEKGPPKSLKDEILIFILCSTSDDWPRDKSYESWSKCEKMKCCFS